MKTISRTNSLHVRGPIMKLLLGFVLAVLRLGVSRWGHFTVASAQNIVVKRDGT
ncbi:hypothetical protein BU25DRAFT_96566 [Macroventuria anomochaeta]|uniref:Uncharacterized protein n=1 Tax=Macroventuria anomochaeta TaxID=301207 RepID=A0ACB6RWU4_9PLEO|nr:uncharacterized protein BU25DRAFT_96566 [Macroventuria anomochaeta]KAF2626371.1 hypothetical protein BU25DRAFT_96566 [Macroventuria anomochaeta]